MLMSKSVFKLDELGLEIATIALPAALALIADPIASLVDTAFIGQIGPVELAAAVGVSIALFNQVSRIAIFPLVSVTTSFVAEEDTITRMTMTTINIRVERLRKYGFDTTIGFVAATQPINALAFAFDGVNFGASDFAYSAYSMVTVAIISIIVLLILSSSNEFVGIWIALTI
ncbi:hypothetical protein CASFOL_010311 [Castilleja foliolosa]|uniref:MATE efflux family protein n=1 Tax=Castilleja foliolosa TaxID=1961234 RepID=A0ABD3DWE0_9LAMI